jgi:glycosyltransferase involved in cell wall biosynthesis
MRRARFIFEIRDLWPQTLVDMNVLGEHSVAARVLWWLEALLVRRAELVLSVLPGIHDYLRRRDLPTEKVVYLPNAVHLASTPPTSIPSALREQFERWRREGAFIATYAGSHGAANALETLLDGADRLQRAGSNVRVAMVGDGPEKERLVADARRRALENIVFFDPIPKTAIPDLLIHSDAGIFHLAEVDVFRYGISSNKLFDYLASGRPVVFACRSGNDPVAEAGAGISIPPRDPDALARSLDWLASLSAKERLEMGRRGRGYVEKHHDIDALGDRLAQLVS